MNGYIDNLNSFRNEEAIANSLIDRRAVFPEQVFQSPFSRFTFLNFDEIFSEYFYERMVAFLRSSHENDITLFVVEPDPESYFFHHFQKYPIVKIPATVSSAEFLSAIFEDPKDSPADAIAYNSSRLLVYSSSLEWAIFGSRDFEVGVFASKTESVHASFQTLYERTFNAQDAIESIMKPAWSVNEFPAEFQNQIIANYGP